jgi:HK97 family phage major capsid protein
MPDQNKPDQKTPDVRNLIGQTAERTFTIERGKVNTDERTIELSFSSETPVEQYNWDFGRYLEILDHSPDACDLTRLNTSGPFLVCHDRYDLAGNVESARIDADRIGRAIIQFSQSERGKEIQTDINDGVRKGISVRYIVRAMALENRNKDGLDTYRVTKWEPIEISSEPISADISVGPGRTLDDSERARFVAEATRLGLALVPANVPADPGTDVRTATTSANSIAAPTAPATPEPNPQERTSMPETIPATQTTAVTPELLRAQDIAALGELAGCREFALDLALQGRTLEEARTAIVAKRAADQAANKPPAEDPAVVAARTAGTQLARVTSGVRLRHFANHDEAYRFGQFLAGVRGNPTARKWCAENGFSLERAHSESDNESGGIFVPQEFSERLILLREKYGLIRQFGYNETMTSNTKVVHRQKGGLTAYPAGAKGASRKVAQSQMTFDGIELVARKWKVTTKLEDELSDDSKVSVADKFAGESAYAFAKAEDGAFFNADGSSSYHGLVGVRAKLRKVDATIANIKGLIVATGNLFSEFLLADFIKTIAILPEYADNDNTAWYCHRTFFWNTIVPLMIAAGGTTVQQIEDAPIKKFLSYPVRVSQTLPRADANSQIPILLGDISLSSTFGDRLGQQVKQTDTNDDDWDNDLMSMKSIERFDINHHDVGDTTEAGPVVGLISASS